MQVRPCLHMLFRSTRLLSLFIAPTKSLHFCCIFVRSLFKVPSCFRILLTLIMSHHLRSHPIQDSLHSQQSASLTSPHTRRKSTNSTCIQRNFRPAFRRIKPQR
ncbi:hypothetical protein B0H14DRAFT_173300 [Mycena olivaceomarginata]|nr:hypothetical protein B0H14DRAFT_173300 [Mycena olivaceomarginata]